MIDLECPHCRQRFGVGIVRNGARPRCPHCLTIFTVRTSQPTPAPLPKHKLPTATVLMATLVGLLAVSVMVAVLAVR
jgi:transposase-like protein